MKFILEKSCPVSVVREFLGGLFGGDGCAPYLSNNRIQERKEGMGSRIKETENECFRDSKIAKWCSWTFEIRS